MKIQIGLTFAITISDLLLMTRTIRYYYLPPISYSLGDLEEKVSVRHRRVVLLLIVSGSKCIHTTASTPPEPNIWVMRSRFDSQKKQNLFSQSCIPIGSSRAKP